MLFIYTKIKEDILLNNLNIYPIVHSNLTEEEVKMNIRVKV